MSADVPPPGTEPRSTESRNAQPQGTGPRGALLRATGVTAGYGGDPVIRGITVRVERAPQPVEGHVARDAAQQADDPVVQPAQLRYGQRRDPGVGHVPRFSGLAKEGWLPVGGLVAGGEDPGPETELPSVVSRNTGWKHPKGVSAPVVVETSKWWTG